MGIRYDIMTATRSVRIKRKTLFSKLKRKGYSLTEIREGLKSLRMKGYILEFNNQPNPDVEFIR